MTPEELQKIAKEYLDYPQAKSLRTGWQDAVSFAEGYLALSVNLEETQEELESNRRCNLFTWKERAEQAEVKLEAAEQERDEAREMLAKHVASRGEVVTSPIARAEQFSDGIAALLKQMYVQVAGLKEVGAQVAHQIWIANQEIQRGEVVTPLSCQPCGCDPAANWTCERHATMPTEHQ